MMELLLCMYYLYTIDITGPRFSNVRYNRMHFATISIRILDIEECFILTSL